MPIFPGVFDIGFCSVYLTVHLLLTVTKSAGIARVVQDMESPVMHQRPPDQFTFAKAAAQAQGEFQLLFVKRFYCGESRTGAAESMEK